MVVGIKMRIDRNSMTSTHKMLRRLGRIPFDTIPAAMQEWGQVLERDMKSSAREAGIKYWGGSSKPLFKTGIQWRQRPKSKIGRLFMAAHVLNIDGNGQRKKTVVSLKPGRSITRWVEDPSKLGRKVRTTRPYNTITVRTHPFIKNGYKRSRPKLNLIIRKHLKEDKK